MVCNALLLPGVILNSALLLCFFFEYFYMLIVYLMQWREMVHWENGMKYSSLSESESTGRSMDACHLLTVLTHRNGSTCTDLGEGGGFLLNYFFTL